MGVEHTYRTKTGLKTESNLTRGKAIRSFCIECMGYESAEIAKCTDQNCPLFPFRMGSVTRGMEVDDKRKLTLSRAA